MTDDPGSPFASEHDFNLTSSFVRSKVSKSQIDKYFAEGLWRTDSKSFRCAYTLRQHLDVLDPFREYMAWAKASIDHG